MDANQTRFHLVLGRDWRAARDELERPPADSASLQIEGDALTLRRSVPPTPHRRDTRIDPAQPRGAARDRRGNFYVVDGPGIRIRCCDAGESPLGPWFWKDPADAPLCGLAITADDILVAGRNTPGGSLLLFDLKLGGPPRSLTLPDGVSVLDLDAHGAAVWLLCDDHRIRRVAVTAPLASVADADEHDHFIAAVPTDLRAALVAEHPLPTADHPLALAALGPDDVAVLTPSRLLRLRGGAAAEVHALVDLVVLPNTGGHDLVADGDRLVLVEDRGDQAFVFTIGDTLEHRAEFVPLLGYSGRGLTVGGGEVWYPSGDRWVPLVALPRPRYPESATVALPGAPAAWDSGLPGCVWHRVALDAVIPPETTVRVRTRAADDLAALASRPWSDEPPLYRRPDGRELPFVPPVERGATWEVLLQGAVGRYLQLALDLTSDGRHTPRLEALRVHYPRFSYLEHYLPAAWREDPVSAGFVDRFLANPEGIFTAIEDRVAAVHRLLDPDRVDPAYLPWLAGWFAATLDPDWTTAQRRFFLRHAMTFFAWRGTRRGIEAAVRLALAPAPDQAVFADDVDGPQILEGFAIRQRVGRSPAAADVELPWRPEDGAEALRKRWRDFPAKNHHPDEFPRTRPADPALAREWEAFCRIHLGFTPSAGDRDRDRFDAFVARRQDRRRAADEPADQHLRDWYDFEAHVRASARQAHRFILVVPPPDPPTPSARQRLTDRIRRVVDAEKPAHTTCEITFFDHEFRPGEVRLGQDTLLSDARLREPPPFVLDEQALGQAFTGAPFPVLPPGAPDNFAAPLPLEKP